MNMAKKKNAIVEVRKEWCKGCAICIDACQHKVLEMKGVYPEVVLISECTACGMCEIMCPDFAIVVSEVEEPVAKK
jgi:2-oxoglutarate ferredoxin oxidoreductase subunit delta